MRDCNTANEKLLDKFIEQTKVHAIILLDLAGNIKEWYPGAEYIFGIPRNEAIQKNFEFLFAPEDIEKCVPQHELKIAESHGAEMNDRWLMRADGSRFWASGMTVALKEGDQVIGFGKVLRNRTELREQIGELRNRAEAAELNSQRKDLFLATLSHELRNPLTSLNNAAELIRMLAPDIHELEKPLSIVDRQLKNMDRLVNDLLDITRIESGKVELDMEDVSLHELIGRAVESTQPLIQRKQQNLKVLLPPIKIILNADPGRLEQVFVNLINNACNYTPEGGNIWVKCIVVEKEALILFEDDGIGIPHDKLSEIFEMFTQVHDSRNGLGIGLALVKNLVTLHGGSIQAESNGIGKGSEFTVRLPVKSYEAKSTS